MNKHMQITDKLQTRMGQGGKRSRVQNCSGSAGWCLVLKSALNIIGTVFYMVTLKSMKHTQREVCCFRIKPEIWQDIRVHLVGLRTSSSPSQGAGSPLKMIKAFTADMQGLMSDFSELLTLFKKYFQVWKSFCNVFCK